MFTRICLAVVVVVGFGLATLISTGLFRPRMMVPSTWSANFNKSVELSPQQIDLGLTSAGEPQTFSVTLRNRTNVFQRIIGAKNDCGCLQPQVMPIELMPHEQKSINVDFMPPVDITETINLELSLSLASQTDGWLQPLFARVTVVPTIDEHLDELQPIPLDIRIQ